MMFYPPSNLDNNAGAFENVHPEVITNKKELRVIGKKVRNGIIQASTQSITDSIRQAGAISLDIYCSGGIPDVKRIMKTDNLKHLHWELKEDELKVILTAKNVLGRKVLGGIIKGKIGDQMFIMKINEGPNIVHLLTRPECLNPASYLPFHWCPSMKAYELCRKTDCAKKCVCKDVYYCSKECQKRDWKTHKEFCGK